MTNQNTRRFFLAGLGSLALGGSALAGAPQTSLRPRMRKGEAQPRAAGLQPRNDGGAAALIAAAGLKGAVSCAVADAKTGVRLEAVRGDAGLPPASVAKTITALYALARLGAGYRFKTRLVATGSVSNGVVSGDLILVGGGDPTLSTDDLAAMVSKLKAAGIREVRGDFLIDETMLPEVFSIDSDQPEQLSYSPAVSGIALNYNRVHFEWKRAGKGYAVAMDARTDRYRPQVAMAQMTVVNRNAPVYTYADRNGEDQWTVASQALGTGGSRWLPVRRPGLYAGDVFGTLARSNGIALKPVKLASRSVNGTRTLVEHQSATLQVILQDMLKWSSNLTAEMVGMTASAAGGKRPGSLRDSASSMSRWAAQTYGMKDTQLVDHSGLGDASRMTPDDLIAALVLARKSGILRPLLKPVALRDAKGKVNRAHPIRVDAKTGTLNFVSGLGGYMTAPDGTELAFAIFCADTATRARIKKADREVPPGARDWNYKAKKLQQALIERWGTVYG